MGKACGTIGTTLLLGLLAAGLAGCVSGGDASAPEQPDAADEGSEQERGPRFGEQEKRQLVQVARAIRRAIQASRGGAGATGASMVATRGLNFRFQISRERASRIETRWREAFGEAARRAGLTLADSDDLRSVARYAVTQDVYKTPEQDGAHWMVLVRVVGPGATGTKRVIHEDPILLPVR